MEESSFSNLKQPTTFERQIEILKERNMIVTNEQNAIEFLQKVNYYRFTGYGLTFLDRKEWYKDGTTFDKIVKLYEFDTKLRNLLIPQLENIEITFRTHIAYLLAHNYGAGGYLSSQNFYSEIHHQKFLDELGNAFKRKNSELFIAHHHEKYNGRFPIWVAIELTTFGSLSKLYENMLPADQKEISRTYYNLPQKYIRSWLLVLSYIRNVCAHFARIYDKRLVLTPQLTDKDKTKLGNDRIFAAIFIMGKLNKSDSEWTSFVTSLEALLDKYDDVVELNRIGFPVNWKDLLK